MELNINQNYSALIAGRTTKDGLGLRSHERSYNPVARKTHRADLKHLLEKNRTGVFILKSLRLLRQVRYIV